MLAATLPMLLEKRRNQSQNMLQEVYRVSDGNGKGKFRGLTLGACTAASASF